MNILKHVSLNMIVRGVEQSPFPVPPSVVDQLKGIEGIEGQELFNRTFLSPGGESE